MQSKLPVHFVLPYRPEEFIEKGFSHCGIYAVHGILRAYKKIPNIHPKELHLNAFSRKTGFTTSWNIMRNLSKYGLKGKNGSARKLSQEDKLIFIKSELLKGYPIILRIDLIEPEIPNLSGKILGHWITIWGYDDQKAVFYAHDSRYFKDIDKTLPIGSRSLTYQKLLADWKGALVPVWWRYMYITVSE